MNRFHSWRVCSVLLIASFACSDVAWSQQDSPPGATSDQTPAEATTPLFVGITVHHRGITTASDDAQRYFDQGLNFAYAFNHDEAIRSFQQALRFDKDCAMAWWGIGLCHGPHINNPAMDEPRSVAAWEAISKAAALRDRVTAKERALIDALGTRYVSDVDSNITDRTSHNQRYADAMREVYRQYPDDPDIAVLFAESLMDLRPWDLWSDDGDARPETPEVLALLESAMAIQPNHPGANHLYVHAIEASPTPEKAAAAADRLRDLMPGSGHMVHMPAHIDVRTGKWAKAAEQNEASLKVDAVYRDASPRQEFYKIYMLHNPHFLSYVCMMQGRSERALSSAREMLHAIPAEFLDQSAALADPFMSIEYQVLIRFGKWDELLELPQPRKDLPITSAMWRFARATALAAKQDFAAAEIEQKLFREACAAVPEKTMGAINKGRDILKVGRHTLAGEIAFQRGDFETAIEELRKGVQAETALLYMDPPEWIQPVRHSLGAVLVAAKRWEEAEQVYRADLKDWPENGWSLFGLKQCLTARGDHAAAAEIEKRFEAAWADADTQIQSTCLCARGIGSQ
ncbi:Tetratricopeptide repeat protein [Stieleria maiorica]|uniref:Tetratricopeptide repeat protein n=1 Tax=Stieleria maiorica TaxID=2795974 RepID=A0A5B9MAL4_9BACT|nr:tetratricopeptide repeat protein [Stieleria maiorica]QEF98331.1 Tetratricopeptide repeat protein [Stieleria maiorica]